MGTIDTVPAKAPVPTAHDRPAAGARRPRRHRTALYGRASLRREVVPERPFTFPTIRNLVPDDARRALAEPAQAEAIASARAWDGLVLLLDRDLAVPASNLGLREIALGSWAHHADGAGAARFTLFVETLLERAKAEGRFARA